MFRAQAGCEAGEGKHGGTEGQRGLLTESLMRNVTSLPSRQPLGSTLGRGKQVLQLAPWVLWKLPGSAGKLLRKLLLCAGEANQGAGIEWVEVPEEQFFIFPAFICVCAHVHGVRLHSFVHGVISPAPWLST